MARPAHTPIPRLRTKPGIALLGYGFRPFFLLAGLSAVVGLALWLADLAALARLPTAFAPMVWHAHEMLFGFAVAAIAGFLLTAIPNWTGRLPLHGRALLGLVLLWLVGRIAVATSALIGIWPAAAGDLAFLAVLLFVVAREIMAGRNWRNLPMAASLLALLVANALMHAEVAGLPVAEGAGWRLGTAVPVLLILLIGGRIVPSFTRNWLVKQLSKTLPAPFGRLDQVAMAAAVAALVAWVIVPGTMAMAALAAAAAILNIIRLARWQGYRTLSDPLVLVLHAGYAWAPIGLGLLAMSAAWPSLVPESAALHAFTVGAVGTMTLAVMTRATLGHTARRLRAGPSSAAVYALATLAAVARIGASLFPQAYDAMIWTAGAAWLAAFAGFVAIYGPMLLSPRVDGKPG